MASMIIRRVNSDGVVHMRVVDSKSVFQKNYGRNEGPPHSAYVPKAKDK